MNRTNSFDSVVTGENFVIRDFINCKSKKVVYLAKCTCPKNYVGKTKREFRRYILDHVGDIRNRRDTSLTTHVWEYHDGDPKSITFCAMELVRPSPRGGDWDSRILQKESRWMYRIRSMSPLGINEQLSFNCFI